MGVYHALACRTTAGIYCSAGNCLQRTALTIYFMRQAAKVDITKTCGELRGDGGASLVRWTMKMRARGMTTTVIVIRVVEINCKEQSVVSAIRRTTGDCYGSSRAHVEAAVQPE